MTQFLLDTNIVIWLSEDNPRISKIKPLLFSEETQLFISAVSWWEIAIKLRSGKLPIEYSILRSLAKNYNYIDLPITADYTKTYLELPQLHKDPFDHMLLAQAITCPMRLVTSDAILGEYSSLVMVV
ncbi:MAG: type II toxin-antitoxin system VapC family toxin [Treponema sp.]|jgi:PIN domain nuclease of toxin-antitoxin system|nr:type II toxin-antitoxin system VapC family toxin [Treponema sp.]